MTDATRRVLSRSAGAALAVLFALLMVIIAVPGSRNEPVRRAITITMLTMIVLAIALSGIAGTRRPRRRALPAPLVRRALPGPTTETVGEAQ